MNTLGGEKAFDELLMEAQAKAAGLQIALESFRTDMIAAAQLVEKHRHAFGEWPMPSDEPWPPMQPERTR